MPDITMAELKAVVPGDEEISAYVTAMADLPAEVTMAEFLSKFLKYAHDAARAKNVGLTAGNLIAAYPAPTATAPTVDPNTGVYSFLSTHSVVARMPVFMDGAVGTSA